MYGRAQQQMSPCTAAAAQSPAQQVHVLQLHLMLTRSCAQSLMYSGQPICSCVPSCFMPRMHVPSTRCCTPLPLCTVQLESTSRNTQSRSSYAHTMHCPSTEAAIKSAPCAAWAAPTRSTLTSRPPTATATSWTHTRLRRLLSAMTPCATSPSSTLPP